MSKRNCVVVLSSDDEDGSSNRSLSSNLSYTTKPKSRSRSTSSRGKKRARVSSSGPRFSKLHEISLLGEDFNEVFTGSKVSAGTQRSNTEELWIDKYKPRSLEELAVHKKKVEEVKMWFEERLKPSKNPSTQNVATTQYNPP